MEHNNIAPILEIIRACDDVHLCTIGDKYPETRQMTNAMNRDAADLTLYFMTSKTSPKFAQLRNNPHCCLYYFNSANRHAIRLFGKMDIIDDMDVRRKYWREDYRKFGYGGPDDTDFVLMRVRPHKYKFYIDEKPVVGII